MGNTDKRHHLNSMLMRESLIDEKVMQSTDKAETPTVRMLPNAHVVKVGASSIIDKGKSATYPLVKELVNVLKTDKLILGTGGGARTKHVFSIGLDLGLPTGVLASLSPVDALGNAHILGALLAPYGVVAIPPEMFGHLLPLFLHSAPGVIFNGVPPYSLWEHPPGTDRIPPHRTDSGCFILSECFGCKSMIFVKDVDGLYDADPKKNSNANFIDEISASDLKKKNLDTLPFDRSLLDVIENNRLSTQFQIINGLKPELLSAAIKGEHVGTIVHK